MMDHLSGLRRQGIIEGWDDRMITAGEDWKGKIDEHLNSAHIVLLLISSSFLSSDYCFDIEMKRAMERHAEGEVQVIPVILRHCEWGFEPLNRFQALPVGGKPVTSWANRDEAFSNVTRGIREVINKWRQDFATSATSEDQPVLEALPQAGLPTPLLPYLRDSSVQNDELRNYVFLGFLAGHRRNRLVVQALELWRRMCFTEGQVTLGVRPSAAVAVALIVSSLLLW